MDKSFKRREFSLSVTQACPDTLKQLDYINYRRFFVYIGPEDLSRFLVKPHGNSKVNTIPYSFTPLEVRSQIKSTFINNVSAKPSKVSILYHLTFS